MAVNLTTVHFLAFVLVVGVCGILIQSATAQTGTPQGRVCTTGTKCITNLFCLGGKCGCDNSTSYYEVKSQSCVPKKPYGALCNASTSDNSTNVCLDPNTLCTTYRWYSLTRCLCALSFYRSDNGECLSGDNLVITISNVSTTTNNATLTWTDNTRKINITFKIIWFSSLNGNITSVKQVNQAVVSNLTAGTEYTFNVMSTLPDDEYDSNSGTSRFGYSSKMYTKPSTPVNVTWDLDASGSSESQFVYTAAITKGEGNAANFSITFVGSNKIPQSWYVPNTYPQPITASFILGMEQTYSYFVTAWNDKGDPSQPLYGTYVPKNKAAKPVNTIMLNSSRDASTNHVNLLVHWKPGVLTGMTTYYILVQLLVEGGGAQIRDVLYLIYGYESNSYTVYDVLAFSTYNVSIKAGTSAGNSSWMSAQIRTAESCPREVLNLNVTQDLRIAQRVHVMFSCPDIQDRNGTIISFLIVFFSDLFLTHKNVSSTGSCKYYFNETIENFIVEEIYTFTIYPQTQACLGPSKTVGPIFIRPLAPNLEDVMKELKMKALVATSSKISKNAEQLGVKICSKCLLDDRQGHVTDVGLIVCVQDSNPTCATYERGKRELSTNHLSSYATWSLAKRADFNVVYRTTPKDWKQTLSKSNLQEEFVIGENASCGNDSFNTYCNGPLSTGRNFLITVVVCTNGGCSQFQESQVFSTRSPDQDVRWIIALGLVVGLVLVGFVIVHILIIIKRRVAVKKECPAALSETSDNSKNIKSSNESQGYENFRSTPVRGSTTRVMETTELNVYNEPSDYEEIFFGNISQNSAQQPPPVGRETDKDTHSTNVNRGQDAPKKMFPYENVAIPVSTR